MELRWSSEAFRDLERIFARIHRENPEAARKVISALYEGCTALRDFPNRGRLGRMKGRRELVFPPLPYIVVYQVKETAVEISRIYHTAQDWHSRNPAWLGSIPVLNEMNRQIPSARLSYS